jgi:hypothetical protein
MLNHLRSAFLIAVACSVPSLCQTARQSTTQNPPITLELSNQTAPINDPITLFTPAKSGLFRASIYVEVIQAAIQPATLFPRFVYTNDTGINNDNFYNSFPTDVGVISDTSGVGEHRTLVETRTPARAGLN